MLVTPFLITTFFIFSRLSFAFQAPVSAFSNEKSAIFPVPSIVSVPLLFKVQLRFFHVPLSSARALEQNRTEANNMKSNTAPALNLLLILVLNPPVNQFDSPFRCSPYEGFLFPLRDISAVPSQDGLCSLRLQETVRIDFVTCRGSSPIRQKHSGRYTRPPMARSQPHL